MRNSIIWMFWKERNEVSCDKNDEASLIMVV